MPRSQSAGYCPGLNTESSTTMTATAENRPRLQRVSASSSPRLSFGARVSSMPSPYPQKALLIRAKGLVPRRDERMVAARPSGRIRAWFETRYSRARQGDVHAAFVRALDGGMHDLARDRGGLHEQTARYRYMSDDFFADCNRCRKPLRESHSHIMVVNVDGGRKYFHAACQTPSPEPELRHDRLTAAS